VELRLTSGPAKLTYAFEPALPHRLLRFERDDGTAYRPAKCERIAYWDMHDPGGESWLPPEVRLQPDGEGRFHAAAKRPADR
jgi:hypothetical protein